MSDMEMAPPSTDIFQVMLAHTCRANGVTYGSVCMGTASQDIISAMYTEAGLNVNLLCKNLIDRKYNFNKELGKDK